LAERKVTVLLDIISLVKSKHAVLNKRSTSLKPKSVTFKEEEEVERFINDGKVDMYSTINVRNTKNENAVNSHKPTTRQSS
jgi:hypothetical protein